MDEQLLCIKYARKSAIRKLKTTEIVGIVCTTVLTSCGAKTNANFLNISWDASPTDALATITSALERNSVNYSPPHSIGSKELSITLFSDPFYDLKDCMLFISILSENNKTKKIELSYIGMIDGDFDHIVQKISKEVGAPNKTEEETEIIGTTTETAFWTLENTEINVFRSGVIGSIEFTPKS